MLTAFLRAFRTPDLRKKLLFTVFIVAVFRLGQQLPTPGVSESAVNTCEGIAKSSNVLQLVNLFSGNSLTKLTVFALGIMPYITASIILQLLVVVIPRLETLRQEGQTGQAKITQYTRYLTIGLAILQSTGIIALARSGNLIPNCTAKLIPNPTISTITTMVIIMTAGTAVIMWLGELITDRGIGNGMSIMIFTQIIAVVPGQLLAILRRKGALTFSIVLIMAVVLYRVHRADGAGATPYPDPVRQADGRPPNVRRYLDLHPAQGESGGCHPGHLRVLAAVYPAARGEPVHHELAPGDQRLGLLGAEPTGVRRRPGLRGRLLPADLFFTYFYVSITFNPTRSRTT